MSQPATTKGFSRTRTYIAAISLSTIGAVLCSTDRATAIQITYGGNNYDVQVKRGTGGSVMEPTHGVPELLKNSFWWNDEAAARYVTEQVGTQLHYGNEVILFSYALLDGYGVSVDFSDVRNGLPASLYSYYYYDYGPSYTAYNGAQFGIPNLNDTNTRYAYSTPVGAATSVPEPFTIIGTLVGGTAALRLRKKLKSTKFDRT